MSAIDQRNNLRYVAIIEARMTSSRLPGKMMMDIGSKPVLQVLVERLSQAKTINEIVVATSVNAEDDSLEELCSSMNIGCHRGSELDVLNRVLGAAQAFKADVIVEITGDSVLLDPHYIDETVEAWMNSSADFAANCVDDPTYPAGMDARVFATEKLAEIDSLDISQEHREHVSSYFWESPDRYELLHIQPPKELYWKGLFIALDHREDLEFIRAIFNDLYPENPQFGLKEIVNYLKAHSEIVEPIIQLHAKDG